MFDWWLGLNTWLRMGVSLALILVSTIAAFAGYWFPWGWGVGVVLLLFSFPNDAQKKGYHDF